MTLAPEAENDANAQLRPRRVAGRIWVSLKIITFAGALVSLFLDHNLTATLFLLGSLFLGAWASFKIRHDDIERPWALFWLEFSEKLIGNLIFLVLFLRLLWQPSQPFPTVLLAGVIVFTLRNVFHLIFAVTLLKEGRMLPMKSIWGKLSNLMLNLTMLMYVWSSDHYARIMMVLSLLLVISTSIGYLYFYYRDENSRKPVSLATQVTFSRILLSPVFIWVFFYDNNLVYQDNNLVFKILAALLAIFLVVSDGLDGYLARKRGEVSTLGKYLDPYSDKISNMVLFLCFLSSGYAKVWMVALIFFRESTVETLRTLGAAAGVTIDARRSGKWKTALQGTATITILVLEIVDTVLMRWRPDLPVWPQVWAWIPFSLMAGVTLFTLISGIDYLVANKKVLERYF